MLPLACGVRDGARIHCWLVSRVVSFLCECVVLTLSLIDSGVESIVLCYRGKFPVEGALYLRYL